ncbi:MAG TPA: hypothetical protein VF271_02425 [Rhodanobacteraceae bacterium]
MNQRPARTPPNDLLRGWQWFVGALDVIRRHPGVFIPMALAIAVISTLVPVFGPLAILIWGPALLAGMAVAAHTQASGHTPQVGQLFALFGHGRLGEATKLCLPLVAGKIVALFVLSTGLTVQLKAQGIALVAPEDVQRLMPELIKQMLSPAMHAWWAAAIIIVMFSWTIAALAIPRVAMTSTPAMAAMAHGFRLVWHHILAWVVAIAALFVVLVVVTGLLMFTRVGLIVELGVLTTMYTLLGPLLYVAWRDLDTAGSPPGGNPPSAPPRPPAPPSSYLEA